MRYEYREQYFCKHRLVFAPIHLPPLNPSCRVFHKPPLFDSSYTLVPEVDVWLKNNTTGNEQWRRGFFVCEDYGSMMVCFVHKHDAMRFKLVWS